MDIHVPQEDEEKHVKVDGDQKEQKYYSVLASLQCFGKHPFVDGNIYTFMPIFFICLTSLNMLSVCFKW